MNYAHFSNSHDLNCRVDTAPGLWPLTISLGATPSCSCSKESGGSLTAKVCKPSEDVAAEQKPTPIKPGYWRNMWRAPNGTSVVRMTPGTHLIDEFHYLAKKKHPTFEIAETRALKVQGKSPGASHIWITAVFFPEEGGAS